MNDIETSLSGLYHDYFGTSATTVTRLPGAGSDRRYYRLTVPGHPSAIGTHGDDVRENRAFTSLAECFRRHDCAVPQIYATSRCGHLYLQEDLGDTPLFALIKGEGESENVKSLVKESLDRLAQMQSVPRSDWEGLVFNAPFDRRMVMWDLNYFKYCFLKPSGITFNEDLLEDDFQLLTERLTDMPDSVCGFMMRDCQSRNVMVTQGGPYFIDFQGGRLGPVLYDAVSMLWQAKAGFSCGFREEMLRHYAATYSQLTGCQPDTLLAFTTEIVLLRTLQVLGAYGFRGLVEKKAHFLESIPGGLANLAALLDQEALQDYPELERTCRLLVQDPRFVTSDTPAGLTVKVSSFSFKKGYPADYSGNGGGFVFDCRAMHNPGRYDEYKHLTGADLPVIEFLESRGEVQRFLQSAWQLTDPAVQRYLERGFTSLQINFGCTGGRHRSLYCAEATAQHIKELHPEVKVIIEHREQGITRILNTDNRPL